ncbi:MAG: hypothetical protein PHO66_02170 [Eubacteriales bacterium]|nr:hypothetical protein [Eubacteriales bacterium]
MCCTTGTQIAGLAACCAPPVGGLAAETVGVALYLCKTHTYLFQLLMDALGLALLVYLLYPKATRKWLFVVRAAAAALAGFFAFYFPSL